jgi:hypothetical protein
MPIVVSAWPLRELRGNFYSAAVFDDQRVMCGRNEPMNKSFACALMAISVLAVTAPADAKGCIKGAIVGGIAGHFVGHHGAVGAAAGCAIGHHEANKPSNPQPSTTGSAPRTAPR